MKEEGGEERRERERSEDRRRTREKEGGGGRIICKKKKRLQIELTASIRGRRFANRCRRELLSRNTMNDVDALNASLGT